jgi:tetratricopeptide (TPR) repeat protein
MNTAANNNRFLMDVFSFKRWAELQMAISPGEFYQQKVLELIKGAYTRQALIDLGNRLITLADHAYAVRQVNTIEQVSQMLLSLPLPRQYEKVGRYYQALSVKRRGKFAEARTLLERVAEDAPLPYRAKATLTIGATYYERGDFTSALLFYIEANRAAAQDNWCDPLTSIQTDRMIAILKSVDGDHRGSLADLRRLLPLARNICASYPYDYYNHLNSLAVELAEAGQLEEAQHICQITLASPFGSVYPEYRATSDEIALRGRRASRSFVSFAQRALNSENILHLPVPNHGIGPADSCLTTTDQPARVLDYINWKNKMGKKPNGDKNDDQLPQDMSGQDMAMKLLEVITQNKASEEKLRKLLEYALAVFSEPDKPDKE